MRTLNLRKYEVIFLLSSSFLFTLINNLPYYSRTIFSDQANNPFQNTSFLSTQSIVWFTLQTLISIIIFSFLNYYLIRLKSKNTIRWIVKYILIIAINAALAYAFYKLSFWMAGLLLGYPFGEFAAISYYKWKYVYLTPSAIIIAYILNLIINKKIVEITNVKLSEENLSIQLKTLQDQVKPHFFFNTLNTLSSIIRTQDKEEGLKFVDDLAQTYRYILEHNKVDMIKLKDEIDFTGSFIRLLKKRFGKNLHIDIDICDLHYSTLVPPMTFQLLLDNAVKHNEISDSRPLFIKIYNDNEFIIVSNHRNQKKVDTSGPGIGLSNLMMRYDIITGKKIQIQSTETEFKVELPLISLTKNDIK